MTTHIRNKDGDVVFNDPRQACVCVQFTLASVTTPTEVREKVINELQRHTKAFGLIRFYFGLADSENYVLIEGTNHEIDDIADAVHDICLAVAEETRRFHKRTANLKLLERMVSTSTFFENVLDEAVQTVCTIGLDVNVETTVVLRRLTAQAYRLANRGQI